MASAQRGGRLGNKRAFRRRHGSIEGYAIAAVSAFAVLLLCLAPGSGADAPLLGFVLAVLLSAWYGGLGPGIFATILSLGLSERFFLPVFQQETPVGMWSVTLRSTLFGIIGLVITGLAHAQRQGEEREQEKAEQQRRLLREVLYCVTDGRLRLCDARADLPVPLVPLPDDSLELSLPNLSLLRQRVQEAALEAHLSPERVQDLITAAGEAGMNAVVHGGGGRGRVYADAQACRVQVWVRDRGKGIREENLHRATLEKGFTTAGTLGYGFPMILSTADRVYLLTGGGGTTVVLEQDAAPPGEEVWK